DSETGPWGPRGSLSSNETRQKCSNSTYVMGVTGRSAGELLPAVVYHRRDHDDQWTADAGYRDQAEFDARTHAWNQGRAERALYRALHSPDGLNEAKSLV
ncbi:hypothetical protein ACPXCH_33215, partial [Streptomyces albogriseolus]